MKNIILYGAGKRGRAMYAFLKSKGANDIITGFCDKKHDEIQKVDDLNVYGIDEVRGKGYLFCITLLDENGRRKIKDTELVGEKCMILVILQHIWSVIKLLLTESSALFIIVMIWKSIMRMQKIMWTFFGMRIVNSIKCSVC